MVVYNTATAGDVTPGLYQNDGSKWVALKPAASCTCGDIKSGLQTANHGDWKLMNGTSYTGSCGTFALNATGLVPVQGGSVGSLSASSALVQNQLPNVAPTVTISSVSGGTPSGTISIGSTTEVVQFAGTHTHTFSAATNTGTSWGTIDAGGLNPPYTISTNGAGSHTHNMNAHSHTATFTGFALAGHNHTATASSINGNVTPQGLTLSNLPRVNVNYFVCVN
jgi:hypothetical protein